MATYPPDFEVSAMLCDSAAAADGKLYVQGGGWDAITTAAVPTYHSRIGLAITVRVPYTETNKVHVLKIRLQDADGKMLAFGPNPDDPAAPRELGGQFNIGRPATLQPGDSQSIALALNIDRQRFDVPGTYAFTFSIDDEEKSHLPFRVVLASGVVVPGLGQPA